MENAIEMIPGENDQNPTEELSFFTYLLRGFIFPCFSVDFYRTAIRQKFIWAMLFFILFGSVFAIIDAGIIYSKINEAGDKLINACESGEFPKIVIQDGITEVSGKQPVFYQLGIVLIAVDTTGRTTKLEASQSDLGILIKESDIYVLNSGWGNTLPLSIFHDFFGNPIIFDRDHLEIYFRKLSIFFTVMIFFLLVLSYVGVRFVYFLLIAFGFWGIAKLSKLGVKYRQILISGIMVNVPVIYISYILTKIGIWHIILNFFALFVIWYLVFLRLFKDGQENGLEIKME